MNASKLIRTPHTFVWLFVLPLFPKRFYFISWLVKVSVPVSFRNFTRFGSYLQTNVANICPLKVTMGWLLVHLLPLLFNFCWTASRFFTPSMLRYLRSQTIEYNSHCGCMSDRFKLKERGKKWFRWNHRYFHLSLSVIDLFATFNNRKYCK